MMKLPKTKDDLHFDSCEMLGFKLLIPLTFYFSMGDGKPWMFRYSVIKEINLL